MKVYDYNEGSCPVAHTADSVYRFQESKQIRFFQIHH